LISLVQSGVLEIHPWGSRVKHLEKPDLIIIDLDPGEGLGYAEVIEGAREVRERFKMMKLESFIKTSGGKGLHVVVPFKPELDWDTVKAFTRQLAEDMSADSPSKYVANMAKKIRKGRIFVDYLRNGRGQTAVAAYSTRARAGATVSVPIDWKELSENLRPDHFNIGNLRARLDRLKRDPWKDFFTVKQRLPKPKR
jgi:bifunctional non-homologous end joining protein LigD